jgi:hypothetical protein
MSGKPVRVFVLESVIEKYCEDAYKRLEAEGKHSEVRLMKKERHDRLECVTIQLSGTLCSRRSSPVLCVRLATRKRRLAERMAQVSRSPGRMSGRPVPRRFAWMGDDLGLQFHDALEAIYTRMPYHVPPYA